MFADKIQTSVRYSTLTKFKNLLSWSTSIWYYYFFFQENWSGFIISPLHTSPNCPAPSFLLNSSDSLGISQASLFRLMTGLDLGQGLVNCRHNPSDWPVKAIVGWFVVIPTTCTCKKWLYEITLKQIFSSYWYCVMHVWLFSPLLWFYILSEFLKQEVCEPMLTTNTPALV